MHWCKTKIDGQSEIITEGKEEVITRALESEGSFSIEANKTSTENGN
jgi:hypothetical protein